MSQRRLQPDPLPLIKVVGISGSGKSTLVSSLRQAGYNARPVSQEHSSVSDLWQQFDRPAILIYLDVEFEYQAQRHPDVEWTLDAHKEEEQRLAHAHEHATIRINTTHLTAGAVRSLVLAYLSHERVAHASTPLADLPRTGGSAKPPSPSAPSGS